MINAKEAATSYRTTPHPLPHSTYRVPADAGEAAQYTTRSSWTERDRAARQLMVPPPGLRGDVEARRETTGGGRAYKEGRALRETSRGKGEGAPGRTRSRQVTGKADQEREADATGEVCPQPPVLEHHWASIQV